MHEDEVLKNVRALFDYGQSDSALIVGNGDDGAVLGARSEPTVLASDMAVEGIHFNFAWSSAMQVGRKVSASTLISIPTPLAAAMRDASMTSPSLVSIADDKYS